MKLVFLTPRFSYPPVKGDKLRPYHFIRHLSKEHEIILVSIIENPSEKQWIEKMASYCRRVETFYMSRIKCIKRLFSKLPLQVYYYYSVDLQHRINEIIKEENPDMLICELILSVIYFQNTNKPKIIDYVDAISLNYQRKWEFKKSLVGYLKLLEGNRVLEFEQQILNKYDHGLTMTLIDKQSI